MDTLMSLQVVVSAESGTTAVNITNKRSLSRVRTLVAFKIVVAREGFLTARVGT